MLKWIQGRSEQFIGSQAMYFGVYLEEFLRGFDKGFLRGFDRRER